MSTARTLGERAKAALAATQRAVREQKGEALSQWKNHILTQRRREVDQAIAKFDEAIVLAAAEAGKSEIVVLEFWECYNDHPEGFSGICCNPFCNTLGYDKLPYCPEISRLIKHVEEQGLNAKAFCFQQSGGWAATIKVVAVIQ